MKHFLLMIAVVAVVGCGESKRSLEAASASAEVKAAKAAEEAKAAEKAKRFKWEFETGDDVESSPTIGSDGTVYVGSNDGKLYAIKTESKGPAKSPWPMRGQNPQHTGRDMAPGRAHAWTASVNQQSLDVFYRGKHYTMVQKVFGKPDKTQDGWWGYTGLNITDGQGKKYSTAWFGFANGVVQQVRLDK